jgi:hypothetical protein
MEHICSLENEFFPFGEQKYAFAINVFDAKLVLQPRSYQHRHTHITRKRGLSYEQNIVPQQVEKPYWFPPIAPPNVANEPSVPALEVLGAPDRSWRRQP